MTSLVPNAATVPVRKHLGTVLIVLILSFLAYTASLHLVQDEYDDDASSKEPRILRLSALNNDDGNMTAATVITVHLANKPSKKDNRVHSIFYTDALRRYGTGRVRYRVLGHDDDKCYTKQNTIDYDESGPCLAATWEKHNDYMNLKCNFPRCRTMVTNDERCEASENFDVRGYYSAEIPSPGYLPLGMEYDSWLSLRKIQGEADFAPASERKFVFNAMFSASTNENRANLAYTIARHAADHPLPVFIAISKEWSSKVNSPKTTQVNSDDYMGVLLDSVFALAPAGHNSESYRMFEAVEAGSIPVFLKADFDLEESRCAHSLQHWHDSPALIVDTWDDLYPVMTALMKNTTELDARQERLGMWYEKYMRKTTADFEDLMLAPVPVTNTDGFEEMMLDQVAAAKIEKRKAELRKRRRWKEALRREQRRKEVKTTEKMALIV